MNRYCFCSPKYHHLVVTDNWPAAANDAQTVICIMYKYSLIIAHIQLLYSALFRHTMSCLYAVMKTDIYRVEKPQQKRQIEHDIVVCDVAKRGILALVIALASS